MEQRNSESSTEEDILQSFHVPRGREVSEEALEILPRKKNPSFSRFHHHGKFSTQIPSYQEPPRRTQSDFQAQNNETRQGAPVETRFFTEHHAEELS
ncbi:hypothetical protein H6P81_017109 [Aristolochia fimbriata]|uniref:Uncharacterized protein n=1 Tax=Aristolochia fimbriata TaxID=158543 RepID=A0AAV7DX86_ARIFI|nr:hypothetical protein H6P81_017109 [Aristolochia fimbriata]